MVCVQFFDKDGSGYITIDEMQAALKDHGNASQVAEHIQDILKDVDKDSDGRIDYEVSPHRVYSSIAVIPSATATYPMLYQILLQQTLSVSSLAVSLQEFCTMMRAGNDEVLKAASTLKHGIMGVKQPRISASPRTSSV